MAGSCCPRGYDEIFTPRFARHAARRYRRRGLGRTERRMADWLARRGLEGKTVLEIGGGVGEIHLELVKRGAVSAVNVELSAAYDTEAQRLIDEAGLRDRVHRRLVDIVTEPGSVEPADLVVLHRVVCCYPDYEGLLGAAADLTREALVFSHPPRNAVSRAVIAGQNGLLRLWGKEFRAFAHPPAAMLEVLRRRGLRQAYAHHAPVWQTRAVER